MNILSLKEKREAGNPLFGLEEKKTLLEPQQSEQKEKMRRMLCKVW